MPIALLVVAGLVVGLWALKTYGTEIDLTSKPKIPIPPSSSVAPTSWVGKKVGDLPDKVKAEMRLALNRVFHYVNPDSGAGVGPDGINSLKLVMVAPQDAAAPVAKYEKYAGTIFMLRKASWRGLRQSQVDALWDKPDQKLVLAPVVVNPDKGFLGGILPKWAGDILKQAGMVTTVIPGGKAQQTQVELGQKIAPFIVGQEEEEEAEARDGTV